MNRDRYAIGNHRSDMSSAAQEHRYKLVLVGDGGVGKTTYIKRLRTGKFEQKYTATMGAEISTLRFHTSVGRVVFNLWDTAGQKAFQGMREGYYESADAAIVMFDTTTRETFESVLGWHSRIVSRCPGAAVVLCGNKVDSKGRKVTPADIQSRRKVFPQYYDISARSNYNFEKPFLYIIRKLMEDNSINFVEAPESEPPK